MSWNFTHTATKEGFPKTTYECFTKSDVIPAKYLAINHEDFYADEQTNVFASRVLSH